MYQLTDNLHLCLVGGTPVLLNEDTGRYLMLRGHAVRDLTHAVGASPADVRSVLRRLDLINENDGVFLERPGVPAASFSHADEQRVTIHGGLVLRAIVLQVWARWRVKRQPFAKTIETLRNIASDNTVSRQARRHVGEDEVASAFLAAKALIGARDTCLPDSLALAQLLRSCGHLPTIVLGVQLPFNAHCWVQCGDRLIGDSIERISAFEPIWST